MKTIKFALELNDRKAEAVAKPKSIYNVSFIPVTGKTVEKLALHEEDEEA